MAIPAITNAPAAPVLISAGVAYSLALTASGTPTSWALATGSLPTGLALNTSTGAITGTPTLAAADLAFTSTVTATNGDGTSTPVTLKLWVLAAVTGLAGDSLALPLDWDIITGKLSIPGVTSAGPAGQPPGAGTDSPPLFVLTSGDRRVIALGLMLGGALREPADIEVIDLVLARRDGEPGILTLTDGTFAVTGSDDTARHEVTAYLDAATLSTWIEDGAEGPDGQYVDLLLEALMEIPEDAREFSAVATSAIASFTGEQTKNHTFSVTLSETLDVADYRITAELLSPKDAGLVGEIELALSVAWTGSAYVVTAAEVVPKSESLTALEAYSWDAIFSIQSVTGDAAGFDVAVRAVSDTADPMPGSLNADIPSPYQPGSNLIGSNLPGVTMQFYDASNATIGSSISVPENPSTWDAAALATAIDGALGAGEVTNVVITTGGFELQIPYGTDIAYLKIDDGVDDEDYLYVENTGPIYTNMSFKLTSIGLAMADTGTRFRSQRAPIRVFAPLA